jgi:hypothetical protein
VIVHLSGETDIFVQRLRMVQINLFLDRSVTFILANNDNDTFLNPFSARPYEMSML